MLILGVLAGAKPLSHLARLRTARVIRWLFNGEKFPDDSTIGRIFQWFSHASGPELAAVENAVRQQVWRQQWRGVAVSHWSSMKAASACLARRRGGEGCFKVKNVFVIHIDR